MTTCKNMHITEHAKNHQEIETKHKTSWLEKSSGSVTPNGWQEVTGRIYTDGHRFVIVGDPLITDNDAEDINRHNCNHMGCGLDHVLYWGYATWLDTGYSSIQKLEGNNT